MSYAAFYGDRFEDFLKVAAQAGATAIEFIPDQTPNLLTELTTERRATLRNRLSDAGLAPVIHSVFYDINLISVVPEVQTLALRVITECGELARDIGAQELVVHPGYRFPGWRSSDMQRSNADASVQRGIEELSKVAEKLDIDVFLENGSYFLTDREISAPKPLHYGIFIDEIELLFAAASSRIGICLDYGKAKVSRLAVGDLINKFKTRHFRFQVGSKGRLRELLSEPGVDQVLHEAQQITFEGPASAAAVFIKEAAQDFERYARHGVRKFE